MTDLPKTFDGHTLGDFIVGERGIARVTDVGNDAAYTATIVLPKETFIEAYNKYIKGEEVERPQGEWIRVEPTEEDIERNLVPLERIECSNCHSPNRHIQYDEYHDEITVTYHNTLYCPNCGAKMKGGAE